MTDFFENSLPKIDNSIAFIDNDNSIIDNYEKSTDGEEKKSQHETELKLNKSDKLLNKSPQADEWYRIFQTILFIITVLGLSYHGFHYGRSEYNLQENRRSTNGFLAAHKKVVTIILGYTIPYSVISSIAALMLTFSLVSRPHWSLPSIIISMSDLVCDVGDALMASWLFFTNLPFSSALFYSTCIISIILGEFWVWLGVLRLYESRAFK
ncbi:uncharacterized protein LOC127288036 isoform X2 [Leptopilina boulardi]|uniref:uncharacterized protein LOC127288036 isoform X2 n=1 Tax=Leptopilina boulardi TaxID=63433 RepID=UPI0021F64607|nr:uncharacterized protein LOC127288036 isoform X2 [Leptopilina boulardi]